MKEVAREYDRTHFPNGASNTEERLQVLQALLNKLIADDQDASMISRHEDLVERANARAKGGWSAYAAG